MASRRQRRRDIDWDYKKLGTTGDRALKIRNIKENNMSEDGKELDEEVVEKKLKDEGETSLGETLRVANLKTLTNNEAEFYEEILEFFEENNNN